MHSGASSWAERTIRVWNACVANYAIGMIAQCIDDWGEAIKLFISAANGFKALSIKLAEEEKAGADKAIR